MFKSLNILVVEDNPSPILDYQMLFEELECQNIRVVDTGEKTIKAYGESKPDVVILDIDLNGVLDGIHIR